MLIWSDQSASQYNWYQASGYSKASITSQTETFYDSSPNSGADCNVLPCQPTQPISVCAEVIGGELIDQSGTQTNYQANPETAFKGNLAASNGVIWKLPSRNDFLQAEVNGIKKVLPRMDAGFWASSSSSFNRRLGWLLDGHSGGVTIIARFNQFRVRCVGFTSSVIP